MVITSAQKIPAPARASQRDAGVGTTSAIATGSPKGSNFGSRTMISARYLLMQTESNDSEIYFEVSMRSSL